MKENSLFDASPLLHRASLTTLQEDEIQKGTIVFSILFNMFKTKARSEVAEKIFARNKLLGKSAPFYRLLSIANEQGKIKYQLQSNHDSRSIIPSGKFPYVVLLHAGVYELRIGLMHHYYLANKSFEVVAAGEILFHEGDILMVNDRSGGYHFDEEDDLVKKLRKLSIHNVFDRVGLPFEKFQSECENNTKDKIGKGRRRSV